MSRGECAVSAMMLSVNGCMEVGQRRSADSSLVPSHSIEHDGVDCDCIYSSTTLVIIAQRRELQPVHHRAAPCAESTPVEGRCVLRTDSAPPAFLHLGIISSLHSFLKRFVFPANTAARSPIASHSC